MPDFEEEKKKGRKEERSKKKKRKAILVSVNKYTTYVVCGCDQEIDAVPHPHSRKVQKYTFRWHDTSFKINAVHICVVLQKRLAFPVGRKCGWQCSFSNIQTMSLRFFGTSCKLCVRKNAGTHTLAFSLEESINCSRLRVRTAPPLLA